MTASVVHDLTGSPSTSTVHTPQLEVSQPQCVPVRPSVSRRKWTSSSRGSTSAVRGSPLTGGGVSTELDRLRGGRLAREGDEQQPRLDVGGPRLAVDGDGDLHGARPPRRARARSRGGRRAA